MYEHWYGNPQYIFSGLLVLFTFVLGIANILLWKANRSILKSQEKLMKLNIISNISETLLKNRVYSSYAYEYFPGFFNALIRAIPDFKDKIKSWYEGDEMFEIKMKIAEQKNKVNNDKKQ